MRMSPRTAAQFEELRNQSRQRILDAALRVFATTGYEGATVRAIAAQAGVSQGLMYNYFDDKRDLVREIFLQGARQAEASLAAAPAGATPEQRFEQFVRGSFDLLERHLDYWKLSYFIRLQGGVIAGLGERLPVWSDGVTGQLKALLRALGHKKPKILARILFATIEGAAQHYVLDPKRYPLAKVVKGIVAQYGAPRSKRVRQESVATQER